MTTINSNINKTLNLEINNEKLELFGENKVDKSNNTTLNKIINFIDNKNLEEKTKNKNKKKKKKDILSFDNINILINQNIKKKISNNEFNKKRLLDLINKNTNVTLKKINISSIKKQSIKNNNNIINTNTNIKRNIKVPKIKINEYINKKKLMLDGGASTNRAYKKKSNVLSLGDEEIFNLINSNGIKSYRLGIYESKNMFKNKYMKIRKVDSTNNNKNNKNKFMKKTKTSRMIGNLYSISKINNKRTILINSKDKKILDSINFTETQISKDKDKQPKKNKKKWLCKFNEHIKFL